MTDQQHPITPPPELVAKIRSQALAVSETQQGYEEQFIIDAYRAGADQEFELSCKALRRIWEMDHVSTIDDFLRELHAARRPKPKSQAEKALETLQKLSKDQYPCIYQDDSDWYTIRRALERLKELEGQADG